MDRRSTSTTPSFIGSIQNVRVESFLWTFLALIAFVALPLSNWAILVTFIHVLVDHAAFFAQPSLYSRIRRESCSDVYWRRPTLVTKNGDVQGISMAIVLVPVLLHSMSFLSTKNETPEWNTASVYAKVFSLALVSWEHSFATTAALFGVSAWIDSTMVATKNCLFVLLWFAFFRCMRHFSSLHRVFSKGEWIVLSSFVAIASAECLTSATLLQDSNLHLYVGMSGLLGCGFACTVVDLISQTSLPIRLGLLISFPLASVELAMVYRQLLLKESTTALRFPFSLWWLADFLWKPNVDAAESSGLQTWRPIYWLVYWVALLSITIPLAPKSDAGTIITRKWFHLVAVLLFTPVTLAAPLLQSLSYAIALAVLMVMECVRRDLKWLHEFYHRYLDNAKDQVATMEDSVIVSHMGLIVGCAAPLWISECIDLSDVPHAKLLLQLWGILSLGVGDAVGAVVGSYFGRIPWGHGRTVEGSLAMFVSMALICWAFLGMQQVRLWFPAVAFVTLLEAFTLQIDNFVLPLAGAVVILLSVTLQDR